MDSTSAVLHSRANLLGFTGSFSKAFSLRHFNKHLKANAPVRQPHGLRSLNSIRASVSFSTSGYQASVFPLRASTHLPHPLKCSNSNAISIDAQENPLLKQLKGLSFESVRKGLSQLTPIDICKWSAVVSVVVAAAKKTAGVLLSPFFWMYFSWSWLFWPWYVVIALTGFGVYSLRKHLLGEANMVEQLAIVTAAFTWLTLVPPAFFNGFLERWPYVFFFVYHYFFFFNVSVRKRLYGDYYPRPHDPKWDVKVPNWRRFLFCAGVMAGHWLAAFEGPELHLIPGGWTNWGIWIMILTTLFMQYHSTLYLAKYSEKVVVPTAVVQFGPYRWVRHPIYSSTMLLFVTYCVALRAPISSLFLIAVCVLYYEQKAKLEEDLMLETFGERYSEYASKVRYRFIPFVY